MTVPRSPDPSVAGRAAAVDAALCLAMGVGSGLTLLGVVPAATLVPTVAAGALGAALTALPARRLVSLAATLAVQLAVATVGVAALAATVGDGTGVLEETATALRDGWSLLLTSVVPAPDRPAVLAVPFLLAWSVTAASMLVSERSSSALAPMAPAGLGLVVAELAGPPEATVPVTGAALVLVAGGVLGVRRAATSWATLGAAVLASTTLFTAGVLSVTDPLGSGSPARLRSTAAERQLSPPAQHPLAALAGAYRDRPGDSVDDRDRVVLRVEFDRAPPFTTDHDGSSVLHLPRAAYDHYDGATWTSSSPSRPVGHELPSPASPARVTTQRIGQRIEIVEPDGPWLATLAGPRRVSAAVPVRFDQLAGVLTADEPPAAGEQLVVASDVPVDAVATRADSTPGSPPPGGRFLDLRTGDASLDPELARVEQLSRALFATPAPYPEQLARLEAFFHNELPDAANLLSLPAEQLPRGPEQAFAWPEPRPDDDGEVADVATAVLNETPTGHSIGRINTFLYLPGADGEPARNAGLGTPEQFATTAVLLARAQGIPSRLVVGYTVPYDGERTIEVRRSHADAWAEVWSAEGGWRALDTTPRPLDVDVLAPTTTTSAAPTSTLASTVSSTTVPVPVAVVGDTTGPGRRSAVAQARGLLVVAALAVVIVAGGAAASVRLQRARRQRGAPADRLAGAWADARRSLRLVGVPNDDSDCPADLVARAMGAGLPAGDLLSLTRLVGRGAHGPGEPTAADAGMAWHHAARVRRTIGTRPRHRLRLALDPRPTPALPRGVPTVAPGPAARTSNGKDRVTRDGAIPAIAEGASGTR